MSDDETPMTKTEARALIRRAREGLRWMEESLTKGDSADLAEACIEAIGSVATVQGANDDQYGCGIRGVDNKEKP